MAEIKKKRRKFKQSRSKFKSGDTVVRAQGEVMNLLVIGVGFDTDRMEYFYCCASGLSTRFLYQSELILKKKGSKNKRYGASRGR